MQITWEVPTKLGGTFQLQTSEGDITLIPAQPPLTVKVSYREDVTRDFDIRQAFDETSSNLELRRRTTLSGWWRARPRFEIHVPPGIAIKVETGGGHISAKGISCNANLATRGGDIKVVDFKGDLTIHTEGGTISVEQGTGSAMASTRGGEISIKSHAGPCVTRTDGGTIRLLDIQGDVEATASAGEIHIKEIAGQVVAKGHAGVLDVAFASGNDRGGASTWEPGKSWSRCTLPQTCRWMLRSSLAY